MASGSRTRGAPRPPRQARGQARRAAPGPTSGGGLPVGQPLARATALLVRSGFEAVNLDGGMRAWASAGLAVETKNAQPGAVV